MSLNQVNVLVHLHLIESCMCLRVIPLPTARRMRIKRLTPVQYVGARGFYKLLATPSVSSVGRFDFKQMCFWNLIYVIVVVVVLVCVSSQHLPCV